MSEDWLNYVGPVGSSCFTQLSGWCRFLGGFFVVFFSCLGFLNWRFFVVFSFMMVMLYRSWRLLGHWRSSCRSRSCGISSESSRRQTHSGSNDHR
ncbi:hypothetical protein SSYM_1252 [Serratia symbiotica str. Tucson]|uniref:Transmembrane protein n=1 Tax=Serratia symbiotica str. Tucson TaxID=914128 RepID=E9CLW2_9GAMM|nr:hypothetical protein SSYM_1252 [Serratia symbiotica str. Tucson]